MNARERIFLAAAELEANRREALRQEHMTRLRISTKYLVACEELLAELKPLEGLLMRDPNRGETPDDAPQYPLLVLLEFEPEDPVTVTRLPYVSVGFDGGPRVHFKPTEDGERILFLVRTGRHTVTDAVVYVVDLFAPYLVT